MRTFTLCSTGTCTGFDFTTSSQLTTATFALAPFDAEECCDQDGRCISVHAIEALRR